MRRFLPAPFLGWLRARARLLGAWPQRIQRGPAAGYRLVVPFSRRGAYVRARHEPHVAEALARLLGPGDAACDLGSHLGYLALVMAARVGPAGRVFAFEPHPGSLALLRRTLGCGELRQVELVPAAVGARSCRGTLELAVNRSMSRLLPGGGAGAGCEVEVLSLDAWAAERRAPRIRLLKLDLEGGELEALRGALDLLAGHRPAILCEVHWARGVPYAPAELTAWLEAAGYRPELLRRPGQRDRDLASLLRRLEGAEPPARMHAFHLLAEPAIP